MAQLISANVGAPLEGMWPQIMTIVQEFDRPVLISDDFELVFYTKRENNPQLQIGQMAAKPQQFVANQLVYTMQVSPFAGGEVGVFSQIGSIQDFYGNTVDLKIGDDFSIYNTTIRPYFLNPSIGIYISNWPTPGVLPQTAVCPGTTAPKVHLSMGPYRPDQGMAIPEDMWSGGNFYYWLNYTFKPEIEGQPFVWEPPFYYAFSGFGFSLNSTLTPDIPPYPFPEQSILYNITSSGAQGVWDTCGWIDLYPRWQGRVQVWGFGSDVFADGAVPWTFPGVANPTGDLSPFAQFGFPQDAQLQFFSEYPFVYPNPT